MIKFSERNALITRYQKAHRFYVFLIHVACSTKLRFLYTIFQFFIILGYQHITISYHYCVHQYRFFLFFFHMANAASKKAAKAQSTTSTKYLPFICVATLLFVVFRVILSGFLLSNVIVFVIYSATYVVAYFGLVEASKNNSAGEYYFDAFCVNVVSQVLYCFFTWGWYLWYIIPGYALYQAVTYYLQMKSSTATATDGSMSTTGVDQHTQQDAKKDKKSRPKMQKIH